MVFVSFYCLFVFLVLIKFILTIIVGIKQLFLPDVFSFTSDMMECESQILLPSNKSPKKSPYSMLRRSGMNGCAA